MTEIGNEDDPGAKLPLVISACLLGVACNHRGEGSPAAVVDELGRRYRLVPICPEVVGGLATPRAAAEIQGGGGGDVMNGRATAQTEAGDDVSECFRRGADHAIGLALAAGARQAVLKARSPSCGSAQIFDGTFSQRLVAGEGVTAAALRAAGIAVSSEEDPVPDPDRGG